MLYVAQGRCVFSWSNSKWREFKVGGVLFIFNVSTHLAFIEASKDV